MAFNKISSYKVVINHEEQDSVLPLSDPVPKGWREVGKTGSGRECLQYIEEVWTDMQLSDRERLLRKIGR